VVNKDQDPAQAGTATGAILPNYTTFRVLPLGMRTHPTLTEPFAPTALSVTSTPPVRVQGITVH
jgi:hypothetical protein